MITVCVNVNNAATLWINAESFTYDTGCYQNSLSLSSDEEWISTLQDHGGLLSFGYGQDFVTMGRDPDLVGSWRYHCSVTMREGIGNMAEYFLSGRLDIHYVGREPLVIAVGQSLPFLWNQIRGDLNNDMTVDIYDLAIMASNWLID